ncbi:MAG: hypothetical protein JNM41_07505 [Flavipsychrobacter sp.]|nr:hypothetical protein [Flavipsychrobacter sp.]
MSFRYHDPATVLRPAKHISSLQVLHDGGSDGASLAVVHWDGLPHLAIRWNVAFAERAESDKLCGGVICHGSPARKGLPTWFILPRELFHPDLFSSGDDQYTQLITQARTLVRL